eukprot:g31292.t1
MIQQQTRNIKKGWWVEKALEAQQVADNYDTQGLYCAVKTIYRPNTQGPSPLSAKDRVTLINDKEAIKQLLRNSTQSHNIAFGHRGHTGHDFHEQQLQEKHRKKNLPLYTTFFSLINEFDTINREALWSFFLQFGWTMKFVTILCLLHNDIAVMILRIHWEERCTNTSSSNQVNIPNVKAQTTLDQLQWAGHTIHMANMRFPKQALHAPLRNGRQTPGGQRNHFSDTLKASVAKGGTPKGNWECPKWRSIIYESIMHLKTC